jgi:hypothetical protein
MDNDLLKKLAHLKILLKRNGGIAVDITQLVNDRSYARSVLTQAEDCDAEEIVLLALELKDKLGLLRAPSPKPAIVPAKAEEVVKEKPKADAKYIFGTRG